jgi:tRNA pseudouridine55 synthase
MKGELFKNGEGLLLIDKPVGITSYDVIRRLKKEHYGKKIGHGGTLDPFASGLLVVGIGSGTKLLRRSSLDISKVYEAEFVLGKSTDTGDSDGKITDEADASEVCDEKITEAISKLVGVHRVEVPIYSAIKVQGKKLYSYAHKGKRPPIIPLRDMQVLSVQLLEISRTGKEVHVKVSLEVSSGVYVRSIGEVFGKSLGVPSMTQNLRRTIIGDLDVCDAIMISVKDD